MESRSSMVQSVIALGYLLVTLLIGAFFAHIFSAKRQSYLLFWTAAWTLYAFHYLPAALFPWNVLNPLLNSISQAFFGFAGICFFLGTQLYLRRKLWVLPAVVAALLIAL